MSTELMQKIDAVSASALTAGTLEPVDAEQVVVDDDGLSFIVRWASPTSKNNVPPGGPRNPDFNPFLPPDPALTIGPVGDHHIAVLNKFPVSARHLVLARTEFHEQQSGLDLADFQAMTVLLSDAGGLAFFNGGPAAGASQRHKHVQWIPHNDDNASLRSYTAIFNTEMDDQTVVSHPGLPVRHCFVRVLAEPGVSQADFATRLYGAYRIALDHLGLRPDSAGLFPPFNLLVEDGWMMVVPRSKEHYDDISVNALSYGGVLQVQRHDQVEKIRELGPVAILRATGYALAQARSDEAR